ncbi:hypothetical protein G6F62_015301 [Rhizopus arrhizus]|nr:hypothetical protein G6F62_015301 [Rhizopus arrhizus]
MFKKILSATVLSLAAFGAAHADGPVRLIIAFPPGGPVDLVGRVLAAQLQARGVHVAGTVRDPAAAPHDGVHRLQLRADAPLSPALLDEVAQADAVLPVLRCAGLAICRRQIGSAHV